MSSESDHPHIRSFSGRRGHFTSGQRSAYDALLPQFGIPYSAEPLAASTVFGRDGPLVLEIGFGMGESTAAIAQAQPERNFLGVEVYPAGVGSLLRRIDEAGLTNLRIIQHDAIDVLAHMMSPASLAAVHVFFPDPWPKARHHKRRLVQAPFLDLLAAALRPGAELRVATDHADYLDWILERAPAHPGFALAARLDARPDDWPQTRYEAWSLGEGRRSAWLRFLRRA